MYSLKSSTFTYLLLIWLSVAFTNCKNEVAISNLKEPEIIEAIKNLEQNKDTIGLVKLISHKVLNAKVLEEKIALLEAGMKYSTNLEKEHMLFSMEFLKADFKSKKSPKILLSLNKILLSQDKKELAWIMQHSLKSNFEKSKEAKSLNNNDWTAINPSWIQNKGLEIFNPSDSSKILENKAIEYIDICEAYAVTHPFDRLSPNLLFQGAELARSLNSPQKAVYLYTSLEELFPDYEKIPTSLFIKSFILDSDLGLKEAAKANYETFLAKFPSNERAKDVQFLLDNLYVSDEDLLKKIGKN